MPPIPAAAENFFHLITQGPPATLMSTLRRAGKRVVPDDVDEQRERQLNPSPRHAPVDDPVDPFSNFIKMERWDWVQMAIGSVFILPIRTVGVILTLLLAWFLAKVGLVCLTPEEVESSTRGRTGWRRRLMSLYAYLGHVIFFVSGFRVTVKGTQASREEAPILVGAPHSSFLEACIMIMCGASPVSRHESRHAILISAIQQFYQSIYVDRSGSPPFRFSLFFLAHLFFLLLDIAGVRRQRDERPRKSSVKGLCRKTQTFPSYSCVPKERTPIVGF